MTETMRALATPATGATPSLAVFDVPRPEPGPGEVRVRVHASAANPADRKVLLASGGASFLHAKVFPLVVGYDFSGTVDAVGEGVTDVAVRDEVFGHLPYSGATRQGAWAEAIVVTAAAIAKKPYAVPHEVAAAAATPGLTALQALRDVAGAKSGDRVMILGASGGVGSLAIGVSKRLGLPATAVCSTHGVALVESLGATEVIDRKKIDPLRVGRRFRVVLDTPSAWGYVACQGLLLPGGTYVATLPTLSFVVGKVASLFSSRRCATIMVQSRRADLETIGTWLEGGMNVPITERYPVREAAKAIERLGQPEHKGRIVVDVLGGF